MNYVISIPFKSEPKDCIKFIKETKINKKITNLLNFVKD